MVENMVDTKALKNIVKGAALTLNSDGQAFKDDGEVLKINGEAVKGDREALKNNGAKITFHKPDVLQTVPDSQTITIKPNMRFQVGICTEKFNSIKFKWPTIGHNISFNMLDNLQIMPVS